MSRWTHVAGVIRYDDMMSTPEEAKKEIARIERLFKKAPSGSEGPVVYSIANRHSYHKRDGMTLYGAHLCDVSFSGDLRDFEEGDWDQLRAWFKLITESKGLWVRQGLMLMNDDGWPESKNTVVIYEEPQNND